MKFNQKRPKDGELILVKYPFGLKEKAIYYEDGVDGLVVDPDDEDNMTEIEEYGKEMEWFHLGKIKFAKINPVGHNSVISPIEDIKEYLDNSEVGEKWEIEIVEMTEEDYLKLPEFAGF